MKIPNKLLELSRNELMVACRLYSIVNSHTKLTTNGYAVCIKQETIAASCGLSVATVKRVLKALSEKGIIFTHQYRQTRANACLGATHYDLQAFSFLSDYFYMPNDVFKLGLSQKMFYAYALFCKLADSNKRSFFHSYNDLAEMMQLKRSEVIELVGALIKTNILCCDLGQSAAKSEPNVRAVVAVGAILIISPPGKHQSAGRKTSIRGKENTNPRKERSNSPKERTSYLDYSIYFMVFLGVYYTLLNIGELGAEGLMLTLKQGAVAQLSRRCFRHFTEQLRGSFRVFMFIKVRLCANHGYAVRATAPSFFALSRSCEAAP